MLDHTPLNIPLTFNFPLKKSFIVKFSLTFFGEYVVVKDKTNVCCTGTLSPVEE